MITYSTDLTQLNENQRNEYDFTNTFHQENNLDSEINQMFNNSTFRN